MLRLLLCTALVLVACSKKKEQPAPDKPLTSGQGDKETSPAPVEDGSSDGTETRGSLKRLSEPSEEERYEKPTERRLYSDRVESSSFLWTDWNRFQENYHPNYAVDGDPKTAWVEGADNSGSGEWLRVHISPVSGATQLRLRIQPGYHKSSSLFEKNARPKQITITALPGGEKRSFPLEDAMKWQEVAMDLDGGPIEAVELTVDEVYEGSRYRDLCLSDLEIFVTGMTVDRPAFEKKKLDRLLAWKKERLEAAAVFADSDKAGALPIAPAYRVESDLPRLEVPEVEDGSGDMLRRAIAVATSEQKEHADLLQIGARAIGSDFDGWIPVDVVSKRAISIPAVDGLVEPDGWELVAGAHDGAFFLPHSGSFSLIDSSRLSVFDSAREAPTDFECSPGKSTFKRPPAEELSGPTPRALLHQWCIEEETREGTIGYLSEILLLFDANGRILFMIGPEEVHYYDWKSGEGSMQILGGERYFPNGERDRLVVVSEVVRR